MNNPNDAKKLLNEIDMPEMQKSDQEMEAIRLMEESDAEMAKLLIKYSNNQTFLIFYAIIDAVNHLHDINHVISVIEQLRPSVKFFTKC